METITKDDPGVKLETEVVVQESVLESEAQKAIDLKETLEENKEASEIDL